MERSSLSTHRHSELVIALVYPLGTDRELVIRALRNHLAKFDYATRVVRVSEQFERLNELQKGLKDSPEYNRIATRMEAGNKARELAKRADFATLAAISAVSKTRSSGGDPEPFLRTVLLIDSLKRPEEVAMLRRIYGAGFFLLGVFASEATRRRYLTDDKNIPAVDAATLMDRDLDEIDAYGQRTTSTFHLADVFVSLDNLCAESDYKSEIWRFLDLVFNHPYHTPTRDENAMFLAYAASFRSGDLSRQVGAAVTSASGDVIAVGCNDVPRYGGGLYWPGQDDQRDWRRGHDSNHMRREQIISEVLSALEVPNDQRDDFRTRLAEASPLKDITEYGRAVHAEMEALLAAGRTGCSPLGGTLYTTTFPCHNCARHIVAAGVRRVVYVEPYPKSKAGELHADSISLTDQGESHREDRLSFEPFVGVGPRRYVDLFSIGLGGGRHKRRKSGPDILQWSPSGESEVRIPMLPTSYLDRERFAADEIAETLGLLGEPSSAPIDEESEHS
ncbi:MAG: cytidine deaminase [Acidobacteria bacterium]|nr:cytidine deaminase [Acidobacteriota bacterium]